MSGASSICPGNGVSVPFSLSEITLELHFQIDKVKKINNRFPGQFLKKMTWRGCFLFFNFLNKML